MKEIWFTIVEVAFFLALLLVLSLPTILYILILP